MGYKTGLDILEALLEFEKEAGMPVALRRKSADGLRIMAKRLKNAGKTEESAHILRQWKNKTNAEKVRKAVKDTDAVSGGAGMGPAYRKAYKAEQGARRTAQKESGRTGEGRRRVNRRAPVSFKMDDASESIGSPELKRRLAAAKNKRALADSNRAKAEYDAATVARARAARPKPAPVAPKAVAPAPPKPAPVAPAKPAPQAPPQQAAPTPTTAKPAPPAAPPTQAPPAPQGMSTGKKVMVGAGATAAIGGTAWGVNKLRTRPQPRGTMINNHAPRPVKMAYEVPTRTMFPELMEKVAFGDIPSNDALGNTAFSREARKKVMVEGLKSEASKATGSTGKATARGAGKGALVGAGLGALASIRRPNGIARTAVSAAMGGVVGGAGGNMRQTYKNALIRTSRKSLQEGDPKFDRLLNTHEGLYKARKDFKKRHSKTAMSPLMTGISNQWSQSLSQRYAPGAQPQPQQPQVVVLPHDYPVFREVDRPPTDEERKERTLKLLLGIGVGAGAGYGSGKLLNKVLGRTGHVPSSRLKALLPFLMAASSPAIAYPLGKKRYVDKHVRELRDSTPSSNSSVPSGQPQHGELGPGRPAHSAPVSKGPVFSARPARSPVLPLGGRRAESVDDRGNTHNRYKYVRKSARSSGS